MKFILVAFYLAHGEYEPQYDFAYFETLDHCVRIQEQYLKNQNFGTKWAKCQKLNARKS